jgi:uncharacterized protein (DUF1778 family)
MASVETTTIRVRRSTHERLRKAAEQSGKSVTQLLEQAADMLEEEQLLQSAERAWEWWYVELSPEERARYEAVDDEWVRELESRPPLAEQD